MQETQEVGLQFLDCEEPLQEEMATHSSILVWEITCIEETWVQPLIREDPLEEEMATHSSILAWEIPWTKDPGGLQSMGSQRVRHV